MNEVVVTPHDGSQAEKTEGEEQKTLAEKIQSICEAGFVDDGKESVIVAAISDGNYSVDPIAVSRQIVYDALLPLVSLSASVGGSTPTVFPSRAISEPGTQDLIVGIDKRDAVESADTWRSKA